MKPLLPAFDGNAVVRRLFSEPVSPIAYKDAPEVVASWQLPRHELPQSYSPIVPVYEWGEYPSPMQSVIKLEWEMPPKSTLYELRDVYMACGYVFSRTGGYFRDCQYMYPDDTGKGGLSNKQFDYLDARAQSFFYSSPKSNLWQSPEVGNGYILPHRPRDMAAQEINEPIFYVNMGWPGFGHVIMDYVQGLWALPLLPSCVPFKLWCLSEQYATKPFQTLELFIKPFGLGLDRMIRTRDISFVRQIYMPSRSHMLKAYITPEAMDVYKTISKYYAPDLDDVISKKIYISRRFSPHRRRFIDIDACEASVRKHGFDVLYPEKIDSIEMIRLFANATHVAGELGSALHHIVFCRRLEHFLVISSAEFFKSTGNDFATTLAFYQLPMHVILGRKTETSSVAEASWTLNPKQFETGLTQWLKASF